jgi:serine/threonine protein kinase
MGEVFRARDTRLDRLVAIKILPADVADHAESRQRFEIEARAVSSLSHPHVCTLFDVGRHETPTDQRLDYLVMELLEGQSLAHRSRAGRCPSSTCSVPRSRLRARSTPRTRTASCIAT